MFIYAATRAWLSLLTPAIFSLRSCAKASSIVAFSMLNLLRNEHNWSLKVIVACENSNATAVFRYSSIQFHARKGACDRQGADVCYTFGIQCELNIATERLQRLVISLGVYALERNEQGIRWKTGTAQPL